MITAHRDAAAAAAAAALFVGGQVASSRPLVPGGAFLLPPCATLPGTGADTSLYISQQEYHYIITIIYNIYNWCPWMLTNRAFAKTGSGQNICEKSFWKTKARFLQGRISPGRTRAARLRCEKRHFLRCHLYIKCIFLPSQARDKHREKHSKKSGVLC
jgi:hypothetical protein